MLTDGVVVLRPPADGDVARLVAGRDEVFHRWMGEGSPEPNPTFVITVDGGEIAGWVDADLETAHEWLAPGEVNCGYNVFARHRGRGLATRSTMLLLHHLAQTTDVRTATLLIDDGNDGSLGIARRCGFAEHAAPKPAQRFFKKPVPPLTYTDGVVTIRTFDAERDFERDMEAKEEEQRRWLWLPWQREHWDGMTPQERVDHNRRTLAAHRDDPRTGPKWSFVIDADGRYCGHVDCDLANPNVAHGEANVSYSSHPVERGKGYVSRAVRLIVRFIAEHTGAREAHLIANPENVASMRVAAAVGAVERGRYVDEHGETMARHVLPITR